MEKENNYWYYYFSNGSKATGLQTMKIISIILIQVDKCKQVGKKLIINGTTLMNWVMVKRLEINRK